LGKHRQHERKNPAYLFALGVNKSHAQCARQTASLLAVPAFFPVFLIPFGIEISELKIANAVQYHQARALSAFTGITAFTNLPLRLWSALGAATALLALVFALWIVVEDLVVGHPVPGWATLVTGLMFSAGIQLLSVGMLGEYIGRIFDEVKQRPVYIIADERGRGLAAVRVPSVALHDLAA